MRRLILICLCAIFAAPLLADALILRGQGNTPLPLHGTEARLAPAEEPLVAMEAETVRIVETADGMMGQRGMKVSCRFTLKSYAARPITRLMAFPIVSSQYSQYMQNSFKVEIGGQPLKTEVYDCLKEVPQQERLYWQSDYQAMKYAGYITWPVTWQPGETKTVTFKADKPGVFPYYCTNFCSALHQEMQGYLIVKPKKG